MTSSTNARRDFSVDADRLLTEDCRCVRVVNGAHPKHGCRVCLTSALAAAYEAGRADAGAYPAQCVWEIYRDGVFLGVCGELRPCQKHDRAAKKVTP